MKNKCSVLLVIGLFVMLGANGQTARHIHDNWEFRQAFTENWSPATVPGIVHLDLFENGVIEDPYYGNNEELLQWIERKNWIYQTTFDLTEEEWKAEHLALFFEGLDTYAEVALNEDTILFANNMFRRWEVDIKPYVRKEKNQLRITFKSPIQTHLTALDNARYELPAANETVDIRVSPYTRKAAYHFGWDWGPRFVTAGIWRPVILKTWNSARITSAHTTTESITEQNAKVLLHLSIQSDEEQTLQLTDETLKISENVVLKKGENNLKYKINLSNPKIWKSRTNNKENFYNLDLILQKEGKPISTYTDRFAIREIELIHEEDSIGTSFYFKLNGNSLFAKGANYIPQDLFLPRVDSSRYEKLIQQAYDMGVNMIRVWGGGIYENEYFYDLCDDYGILVWQDFMFANSMYPNDSAFLKNVEEEVIDNIQRLRHHPSIAVWCGNNEIEVAWENWGWQRQYNYSKEDEEEIFDNYLHIFHELIPNVLKTHDTERPYTTTTPLSNWGTPENFNHATMHYWGVWHGREPIENFATNIGRFNTEYGYQSFPSVQTLLTVMDSTDLDLNSEVMQNRQKSYIGNGIIEQNVLKYAYREENFAKWCILTQKVQGHAMGYAIRQHRINTPHCMGTLFWQLNDCWPGPTWSVIDYYGNEKEAYQEIQRDFSPIIAHLEYQKDSLQLSLVSDMKKSARITVKIAKDKAYEDLIYENTFTLEYLTPIHTGIDARSIQKKCLFRKKEASFLYLTVGFGRKKVIDVRYDIKNNSFTYFTED